MRPNTTQGKSSTKSNTLLGLIRDIYEWSLKRPLNCTKNILHVYQLKIKFVIINNCDNGDRRVNTAGYHKKNKTEIL